jgi:hypothetical protein
VRQSGGDSTRRSEGKGHLEVYEDRRRPRDRHAADASYSEGGHCSGRQTSRDQRQRIGQDRPGQRGDDHGRDTDAGHVRHERRRVLNRLGWLFCGENQACLQVTNKGDAQQDSYLMAGPPERQSRQSEQAPRGYVLALGGGAVPPDRGSGPLARAPAC